MTQPTTVMIALGDVGQHLLPGDEYSQDDTRYAAILVDNFQRDYGSAGLFGDVYFDGLVVQVSQNSDAEKEFSACIELLQLGGYKPAVARLGVLLERYPYHSGLLYNIGMAYREMGDIEKSLELLERLRQIAPDHTHGAAALAVSLYSARRLEEALEVIQQAYADAPNDPFVGRTYGTLLASAGKRDEALTTLARTLELMPDDAQSHLTLGQLLLESEPARAKHHLEAVLRLASGSSLAEMAAQMLEGL